MFGTMSPQFFAYNQKNVTVLKLILFFCCIGMKLALSFCDRVKKNKLLQSSVQTVTTSEALCHNPVCDDVNELPIA